MGDKYTPETPIEAFNREHGHFDYSNCLFIDNLLQDGLSVKDVETVITNMGSVCLGCFDDWHPCNCENDE